MHETYPTWDDIERAALFDTVLHAAVTLVRQGDLTREQALIAAAVALADANKQLREDKVQLMMRQLMTRLPPIEAAPTHTADTTPAPPPETPGRR